MAWRKSKRPCVEYFFSASDRPEKIPGRSSKELKKLEKEVRMKTERDKRDFAHW
ncbi:MAG: hypothetical protein V1860_02965 [bacterium]